MAESRGRAEHGTTLAEVLVVLTISALIAVPLLMVLQQSARSERSQSERIDRGLELDRVLTQLQNDVRAGAAAPALVGGRSLDAALPLVHQRAEGGEDLILWAVVGDELRRRVTDRQSGAVISSATLLTDVTDDDPWFQYFDQNGGALPTVGNDVALANCTVRIRAVVSLGLSSAVLSREVEAAHRSPSVAEEGADPC